MRNRYLKYAVGVAVQIAALCSCSEMPFAEPQPDVAAGGSNEILLSIPAMTTRTAIDDDEGGTEPNQQVKVKWAEGDAFAMWAYDHSDGGDGKQQFGGVRFEYDPHEPVPGGDYSGENLFRAWVYPEAAKEDVLTGDVEPQIPISGGVDGTYGADAAQYDYCSFYPVPTGVTEDGGSVYYDIATEQSGLYDGKWDIMYSKLQYTSLIRGIVNTMPLTFTHKTHALKITVPTEARNKFAPHKVSRISIQFGKPVAGRMLCDIRTGAVSAEELSRDVVDVRFDDETNPFAVGKPFWVFVAPVDLRGCSVSFRAYDDEEGWMSDPVTLSDFGRNLQEAHITPMTISLDEGYQVTWFDYEILNPEDERLGEELQSLNITLPEGWQTADRAVTNGGEVKLEKDAQNHYRIAFRTDELQRYMEAAGGSVDFNPWYESEHALLRPYSDDMGKFVATTAQAVSGTHSFTIDYVPYLFEEDFSSLVQFDNEANYTENSNGSLFGDGSKQTTFHNGWSGGRVGGMANVAIRIACRREGASILGNKNYPARVDSAPISNLKEGVSAKLNVVYNWGMDKWGRTGTSSTNSRTDGADVGQTIYFGYVESSQTYNSGDTFMVGECGSFHINEAAPSGNQDAGFDNITHVNTESEDTKFQIAEGHNYTRLTWRSVIDSSSAMGNNTCWFYIDNIKVSIAK